MNYKRLQRVAAALPVIVASLFVMLLMNACGGGGGSSTNIPVPGRNQFSSSVANLTTVIGRGFSNAVSAGNNLPSNPQPASRRSQCPEVVYEYDEERDVYVLTAIYEGCTDEDGITYQGALRTEISVAGGEQAVTIEYQDYDDGTGKMNGTMRITVDEQDAQRYQVELEYTQEPTPGCVIVYSFSGFFTVENADDDFGVFNGSGTITLGSRVLNFTTQNVRTAENCDYPVGGAAIFELNNTTITLNYSDTCGTGFIQTAGSNPEPVNLAELVRNFSPCVE